MSKHDTGNGLEEERLTPIVSTVSIVSPGGDYGNGGGAIRRAFGSTPTSA